ncbi:MAG: sel1 repeat family protein [Oscillospiraceae bacterium]|nr:sel1 repeat family protein [Oscillospiraceae bacterium]
MDNQQLKDLMRHREYEMQQIETGINYYVHECNRLADIACNAGEIISKIDHDFAEATKLNGTDIAFLFLTTALQCARQYIFANDNFRLTAKEGDNLVKNTFGKITPKSWQDIIFQSVPYDAVQSDILNTGISGATHRYRTLGHDPVIGWIIGPCNMVTDSLTKTDFITSYKVSDMRIVSPYKMGTAGVISDSISAFKSDSILIPTTIIRQAMHFGSDYFTKMGLPLPFVSSLNNNLSKDMLSRFHIDSYSVLRGATIAIIINNIISCMHKLFYDPKKDGSEDLYEVRTRKIIDYSNVIASGSNIIYCAISKDLTKLDVGGILVTIIRLIKDYKFIQEVKEEFLRSRWNEIVLNSSVEEFMKEKKLSSYERGIRDGAAPMEEKFRDATSHYEGLKYHITEHTETQDRINSAILGKDYEKLCNDIKREKVRMQAAEMQYLNYGIGDSFPVFYNSSHVSSAYYYLGEIYYNGYGNISKDISKSCHCFVCGYEQGDMLCSIKLAEYFPTYLPENVLPQNIFDKFIPEMTAKIKDPTETNAIIEYELGLIFEMGYGKDIDKNKAFEYYNSAADKKFFKALHSVYRCYVHGIGTDKDTSKAESYLIACNKMGYKINI